jgi:hypothetical protein
VDDMGERRTPTHRAQLIRRQHLRIRTIAVSFAAAVTSARQDMDVGAAERDALIETWRAWSLGVLEGYGAEMDEVARAGETVTDDDLASVRSALATALERVRSA